VNPLPPNTALRDLESLIGAQATREIVHVFLEDFPVSIHNLGICAQNDQMRIAHGLRSSALHMGAEKLSRMLGELEDHLSRPGGTVSTPDLEGAMAEFEAFAGPLRSYASG